MFFNVDRVILIVPVRKIFSGNFQEKIYATFNDDALTNRK